MQKSGTIYVVDDDDIYQFIMERTIAETNLMNFVKTFSNGKDAIDFLERSLNQPELLPGAIFLDLTMPVMDGWEFLENYFLLNSRIRKKISIYIVSSSINPADVERAKNISVVSDYLTKPLSKDKLISILNSI